jgi:hypothetical protein
MRNSKYATTAKHGEPEYIEFGSTDRLPFALALEGNRNVRPKCPQIGSRHAAIELCGRSILLKPVPPFLGCSDGLLPGRFFDRVRGPNLGV